MAGLFLPQQQQPQQQVQLPRPEQLQQPVRLADASGQPQPGFFQQAMGNLQNLVSTPPTVPLSPQQARDLKIRKRQQALLKKIREDRLKKEQQRRPK